MSLRSLLILLVLVAGAGWLLLRTSEEERARVERTEWPLFPGFEAERITCVRAENLARGWNLRLERVDGRWQMRDPQELPAQDALVGHLIQNALAARASEVAEREQAAVRAQFEPPQMILEFEADGRRERVEFGAEDSTRGAVFVRTRGVLARVGRDLSTALNRPVQDFKTTVVLDFAPAMVRSIERAGAGWTEGALARSDAELRIEQQEGEWRMLAPVLATPDLAALSAWLQGLAGIRHEGYVDELGRKASDYGLDPAGLTLRLELSDGRRLALRMGSVGPPGGESWFAMREDLGVVWGLEPRDAYLLSLGVDTFLENKLLRVRRDEVDTLRLKGERSEVWITREGRAWKVAERRAGEKGFDPAYPGESAAIEALLGELSRMEIESFRLNQPLRELEDSPGVWIGAGGSVEGGFLGERLNSPQGSEAVLMQRRGEAVTGYAPVRLWQIAQLPAEQFWSRMMLEIEEHAQVALELRLPGESVLLFRRSTRGMWSRDAEEAQARELLPLLDALCFVRASSHLSPRTDLDWVETIRVRFREPGGKLHEYQLGRNPAGAIEVVVGARRALLADPSLFDKLKSLSR